MLKTTAISHRRRPLRALALAVTLAATPLCYGAEEDNGGFWSPFNRALDSFTGFFSGEDGSALPADAQSDAPSKIPIDQPQSTKTRPTTARDVYDIIIMFSTDFERVMPP